MHVRRDRYLIAASGAAALVLAGAGASLAALATSTNTDGARRQVGDVVSSRSVDSASPDPAAPDPGAAPGTAASRAAAPPVPGAGPDRYAHDVTEAAACSPPGALGFTAQVRVLRCASTATDSLPRWRTP
jgi:hypothetical protein